MNSNPPPPPPRRPDRPGGNSGKWVVIVLLAAGVIAGVAAMKFRKMPGRPTTNPATTQTSQPAR